MPSRLPLLRLFTLAALLVSIGVPVAAGPPLRLPRPGTPAFDRYMRQKQQEAEERRKQMQEHLEEIGMASPSPNGADRSRSGRSSSSRSSSSESIRALPSYPMFGPEHAAANLKKVHPALRASIRAALNPAPNRVPSDSTGSAALMKLAKRAAASGRFEVIVPGLSPQQRLSYLWSVDSSLGHQIKTSRISSLREALAGLERVEGEQTKLSNQGPVKVVTAQLVKNNKLYRYEFTFVGEGSEWKLDSHRTTHLLLQYKAPVFDR